MRVCNVPDCPKIYPKAEGSRCSEHRKKAEVARGSRQARGYDKAHIALRNAWKPKVESGSVLCSRCHQPILGGQAWHLDHDDNDRSKYKGPSHRHCNLSAGGKASHQ